MESISSNWWAINQKITELQGYDHPTFKWQLLYKPENTYAHDCPLGKSCWYVALEVGGASYSCYAQDPATAVYEALKLAVIEVNEAIAYLQTQRNYMNRTQQFVELSNAFTQLIAVPF